MGIRNSWQIVKEIRFATVQGLIYHGLIDHLGLLGNCLKIKITNNLTLFGRGEDLGFSRKQHPYF